MAQKTYQQVHQFFAVANAWLTSPRGVKDSKFRYAVRKVFKAADALVARYQEELEELGIEHCLTDEKQAILRDDHGGFKFTKDGQRKYLAGRRKLFESSVEIAPHIVVGNVPDNLTDVEREAFAGFVLPELTDDELAGHSADGQGAPA